MQPSPEEAAARARFHGDLAWLPDQARAIYQPRPVPVQFTQPAERLREQAHDDVARRVAAIR